MTRSLDSVPHELFLHLVLLIPWGALHTVILVCKRWKQAVEECCRRFHKAPLFVLGSMVMLEGFKEGEVPRSPAQVDTLRYLRRGYEFTYEQNKWGQITMQYHRDELPWDITHTYFVQEDDRVVHRILYRGADNRHVIVELDYTNKTYMICVNYIPPLRDWNILNIAFFIEFTPREIVHLARRHRIGVLQTEPTRADVELRYALWMMRKQLGLTKS